jgi:hypothetical protein
MPTLNQIASELSSTLNQPFNHELKERIKDIVKSEMSLFIRQSITRHGIDETLILSYIAELEISRVNTNIIKEDVNPDVIKTKHKVPTPVRYDGDSPFIFVGSVDEVISFPYRNKREANYAYSFFPTGTTHSYYIENKYIFLNSLPFNSFKAKYIKIKAIFENPDLVLSMYDDNDGQDLVIPLPLDILSLIRGKVINLLSNSPKKDSNITAND